MMMRPQHCILTRKTYDIAHRGASNGCPFCQARIKKGLSPGDRIILLRGYEAGIEYLVDCRDATTGNWLCKAEGGEPTYRRVLNPSLELYLTPPLPKTPDWALSLSVEDHVHIDDVLMQIVEDYGDIADLNFDIKFLYRLAAFCWANRIPFDVREVIGFLSAHGLNEIVCEKAKFALDYARFVLVSTNGKAAIKRRKMPPLSQFRYWPSEGRKRVKSTTIEAGHRVT
jgi:hypothetical protein